MKSQYKGLRTKCLAVVGIAMYGNKKIRIGLVGDFCPFSQFNENVGFSSVNHLDIWNFFERLPYFQYDFERDIGFSVPVSGITTVVTTMAGVQNHNKWFNGIFGC